MSDSDSASASISPPPPPPPTFKPGALDQPESGSGVLGGVSPVNDGTMSLSSRNLKPVDPRKPVVKDALSYLFSGLTVVTGGPAAVLAQPLFRVALNAVEKAWGGYRKEGKTSGIIKGFFESIRADFELVKKELLELKKNPGSTLKKYFLKELAHKTWGNIGALIGGLAGAVIGGPVGAIAGFALGRIVGHVIGKMIAKHSDSLLNGISGVSEAIIDRFPRKLAGSKELQNIVKKIQKRFNGMLQQFAKHWFKNKVTKTGKGIEGVQG